MKLILHIDDNVKENIVEITAKCKTKEIEEIISICNDKGKENIIGYLDDSFKLLDEKDICYFIIENRKLFVYTYTEKYLIKKKLFEVCDILRTNDNFVMISQSCLANIKNIEKFDLSFNGTIGCIFKNKNKEYTSRGCLPLLKQKLRL